MYYVFAESGAIFRHMRYRNCYFLSLMICSIVNKDGYVPVITEYFEIQGGFDKTQFANISPWLARNEERTKYENGRVAIAALPFWLCSS